MKRQPPGRAGKGESNPQTKVISARLNREFEEEARALEIFEEKVNDGYSPRQILTDALLRAGGYTPDMFRRGGIENASDLTTKIDELYHMFASSIGDILKAVKRSDVQKFRQFANSEAEDDTDLDLDEDFIRNARNAVRRSYRQGRGEDE